MGQHVRARPQGEFGGVSSRLPSSTQTTWENNDLRAVTTSPTTRASLNAGTMIQTPDCSMTTT